MSETAIATATAPPAPQSWGETGPSSQSGRETNGGAPATDQNGLARFYMTSDLRAATGLTRTHLDYYLREGVIVPTARTESGYLLFDGRELETLRAVIAQRRAGLGIREIKAQLGR